LFVLALHPGGLKDKKPHLRPVAQWGFMAMSSHVKQKTHSYLGGTVGLRGRFNLPSRADPVCNQVFAMDSEMSSRLFQRHGTS
jgi:hypothetical protein